MLKSKFCFVLSILLPMIVGGASALLTRNNMNLYQEIVKPPLSPPAIVFPIVWTILYVLMGVASYFVMASEKSLQLCLKAYFWYLLQLAMNFCWSIFFFNMKMYRFSLIWLIGMYAAVIICTGYYFKLDKKAGWLMVPYNIWMAVALCLNLGIVVMN